MTPSTAAARASRSALTLALLLLGIVSAACGSGHDLIVAATTSTRDSGLLDDLIPIFEEETGYNVKVIAVGSGAGLRLGAEGEADVVLAHSPEAEEAFMKAGYGIRRRVVMHNDFVIVGPTGDPAGLREVTDAAEAMRRIAETKSLFVSRGDDSGTHAKELRLWALVGVDPNGGSYQESGTGMGQTLLVANEKSGYTLSDRATFVAFRDKLALRILLEGDPALFNVYHVIQVNPETSARINVEGAAAFVDFITSSEAQEIIRRFGLEEFGEPLFVPNAYLESTDGAEAD